MNPTLYRAVLVVTFALLFYSVAIITEQRKHVISKRTLVLLTIGVFLDISSTVLMIAGSRNLNLTVHGVIGYTALTVMLIDTILIWRFWTRNGSTAQVPRGLHLYTRLAYGWWAVAYVAGGIIAMVLTR